MSASAAGFRDSMKPCYLRAATARALFVLLAALAARRARRSPRASACCPTSTRPRPRPTSMRAFRRTRSRRSTRRRRVPTLQSLTSALRRAPRVRGLDLRQRTAVGNVAAAFAETGRAVVLGTFYDQDRSDGPPRQFAARLGRARADRPQHDRRHRHAVRAARRSTRRRMLRPSAHRGHHVAHERQVRRRQPGQARHHRGRLLGPAERAGQPDPAIAYRITGAACVIQVAMAPNYPCVGVAGHRFQRRLPSRVEERVRLRRRRAARRLTRRTPAAIRPTCRRCRSGAWR